MLLRSFCLLLTISGPFLHAADDPKEIVRRALKANNHNRELERSYTFTERKEERTLGPSGEVKSTKSETWDVIPLQGAPFRRLMMRDDRPLSAKEEQQQQATRAKLEAARQKGRELREKETPEQRQKRIEARDRARKRDEEQIDDIVAGFNLRLVGEDQVDGVPVWIIEGEPQKGHKFQSREANMLFSKMKGRIWISQRDYQPVHIEAETTDTISFGLFLARVYKGTQFKIDFTFVNQEVWLMKREEATISARIALLKGYHLQQTSDYTNYHKFSTDSRIVEVDQ